MSRNKRRMAILITALAGLAGYTASVLNRNPPLFLFGEQVKVGDLTYSTQAPDRAYAIIHEIDYEKEVVTFLMTGLRQRNMPFGRVVATNTYKINFECFRNSLHRRWPEHKDAGMNGYALRMNTPYTEARYNH